VKNEMQAEVDRLYLMFVDTVARNRGISTQRVKDTQAALFWGPDAVKSGLADSAGNIGDALGALASVLPTVTAPQRVISIAGTSVAANSEQKAESHSCPKIIQWRTRSRPHNPNRLQLHRSEHQLLVPPPSRRLALSLIS
jgi:ClpP class serine protease